MFQIETAVDPDPERSGDRRDDGSGHHDRDRDDREHDHHHDRDEDLQRPQLPDRPSLGRLVDDVRGAHERADVARGRPQRRAEADDEQDARGASVRGDRSDRTGEGVCRRPRADLRDDVGQRSRRRSGVADERDDRDERDQRREQRQQPVVRQRRRPVAQVVLAELRDRPLDRREQTRLAVGPGGRVVRPPAPGGGTLRPAAMVAVSRRCSVLIGGGHGYRSSSASSVSICSTSSETSYPSVMSVISTPRKWDVICPVCIRIRPVLPSMIRKNNEMGRNRAKYWDSMGETSRLVAKGVPPGSFTGQMRRRNAPALPPRAGASSRLRDVASSEQSPPTPDAPDPEPLRTARRRDRASRTDPRRGREPAGRPPHEHGAGRGGRRRRPLHALPPLPDPRSARAGARGSVPHDATARHRRPCSGRRRRCRSARRAARPRPSARARGDARARRGPAAPRPRPARRRGAARRRRRRRALRRRHRRLAAGPARGLGGIPRPSSTAPPALGPEIVPEGLPRFYERLQQPASRGASPSRCGSAAACSACCCASARRSRARGHRQAGRCRARARQRLHRRHRGGAPPQADHPGRRGPAAPASRRGSRASPARSSPVACSRHTRSAATGSTSSRTATAHGSRSPTPPATAPPPPDSAPRRSERSAPHDAAGRPRRARCEAMDETVRQLGNPDFHITAIVARWHAATSHARLGQLRPPARLSRQHRR